MKITSDREHPLTWKCCNFNDCGVSCSHSPEYAGWYWIAPGKYSHTPTCGGRYLMKEALKRMSEEI